MKMVKNCHKLILSDAIITDNVFNLIRIRPIENALYIDNLFEKYQNVPAIRIRDESLYLNEMIEHIKTSNYFLAASDSCTTITKLFHECKRHAKPDDVDNFILITAYSKFQIYDASEQFKNKFVFYSPSIVFGIDFSIDEITRCICL
jgi:hypothetical protein